jgi:hypothetical protein
MEYFRASLQGESLLFQATSTMHEKGVIESHLAQ